LVERRAQILASIAVTAIAVGGLLHGLGAGNAGNAVWGAAVALLAAELAFEVGRTVVVEHSLGVDAIALVAMVGALALAEELAGSARGRSAVRTAPDLSTRFEQLERGLTFRGFVRRLVLR
jgi:hypothetical protein